MYDLEYATTSVRCDSCGAVIRAGEPFARPDGTRDQHCGRCAIRLGAIEMRASLESIRDRIERLA